MRSLCDGGPGTRPGRGSEGLASRKKDDDSNPVSGVRRHRYPSNRVGLGGLEPPTSSLSVKRSNRLSYRPSIVSPPGGATKKTLQDPPSSPQIGVTHARRASTPSHRPDPRTRCR